MTFLSFFVRAGHRDSPLAQHQTPTRMGFPCCSLEERALYFSTRSLTGGENTGASPITIVLCFRPLSAHPQPGPIINVLPAPYISYFIRIPRRDGLAGCHLKSYSHIGTVSAFQLYLLGEEESHQSYVDPSPFFLFRLCFVAIHTDTNYLLEFLYVVFIFCFLGVMTRNTISRFDGKLALSIVRIPTARDRMPVESRSNAQVPLSSVGIIGPWVFLNCQSGQN